MKAVRLVIITSVVLLGNACSLWTASPPELPVADFLSTSTGAFQGSLRSAEQRTVSTAARTATTRETYEKLKKDFKEADERTKPALAVQLAGAQSDYIMAQEQHMQAKRLFRRARDAYLYKLYLNKHPEAAETPAFDITAEAGLPAAMAMAAPAPAGAAPPVQITAKPQTPAEEGAAGASPASRPDNDLQ
ncbi:MAG: hypothetical protein U1F76_27310 [Candidatus Competibacteraceae bacterium]